MTEPVKFTPHRDDIIVVEDFGAITHASGRAPGDRAYHEELTARCRRLQAWVVERLRERSAGNKEPAADMPDA